MPGAVSTFHWQNEIVSNLINTHVTGQTIECVVNGQCFARLARWRVVSGTARGAPWSRAPYLPPHDPPIASGLTPRARFCSLLSHARHSTVDSPLEERMPSRPVSHLMPRSTLTPMTPPVQGTWVGTVRLRGVPSGLRPVLCAFQCFFRNSSVNLPRWPYSGEAGLACHLSQLHDGGDARAREFEV